jgi:Cysteine-rich secretory protein family
MNFASLLGGETGRGAMKVVWLAVVIVITSTLAHAQDMAEVISRYRREHGLSTVKTDPQLTAIAERQAKAMAASGIMDHSVAGSFTARISGARTAMAAENIAAGTKTWEQTFHMWQNSPGHNANLLLRDADVIGVAVAHNDATRYKTYWAMVIGHKKSPDGGGKLLEAPSAPPGHEASKASTAGATVATGAANAANAAAAAGAAAAWVTNALSTGRKWLLGE